MEIIVISADIPDYAVVVGVPAKQICTTFDQGVNHNLSCTVLGWKAVLPNADNTLTGENFYVSMLISISCFLADK